MRNDTESAGLLTARPDTRPMLYVAEYALDSDNATYRSLDVKKFPGLVMLHTVSCGSEIKVITYWSSIEYFQTGKDQLKAALNSIAPPLHGYVDHTATIKKPWYRKVSAYTAVVTLVAVLSTAKSLAEHYDWFFSAPNVTFQMEKDPLNVVDGDEFHTTVTITNHSAATQRRFDFRIFQAPPASGQLTIYQSDFGIANLAPGASHPIRITGRAHRPGKYGIRLEAKAKAGLLSEEKTMPKDFSVTVWPAVPTATVYTDSTDGVAGVLRGRIQVARPASALECDLQFQNISGLQYYGEEDWTPNDKPGHETYLLRFRTRPVKAFDIVNIPHQFESTSERNWKKVAAAAQLKCVPVKELNDELEK